MSDNNWEDIAGTIVRCLLAIVILCLLAAIVGCDTAPKECAVPSVVVQMPAAGVAVVDESGDLKWQVPN